MYKKKAIKKKSSKKKIKQIIKINFNEKTTKIETKRIEV